MPTLATIKTNLVDSLNCDENQAYIFAEELLAPHISHDIHDKNPRNSLRTPGIHYAVERNDKSALERENDETYIFSDQNCEDNVHFGEFLYDREQEETHQSEIAAEFSKEAFNVSYVSEEPPRIFDCSIVHLSDLNSTPELSGFCIDIGAPRSVIGKKTPNKILRYVDNNCIPIAQSGNSFALEMLSSDLLGW